MGETVIPNFPFSVYRREKSSPSVYPPPTCAKIVCDTALYTYIYRCALKITGNERRRYTVAVDEVQKLERKSFISFEGRTVFFSQTLPFVSRIMSLLRRRKSM